MSLTLGVAAIAMRVDRLEEPYAVLEPERLVRERTHRAYIDHIAYKIILQILFDKSSDLAMVAAIQHPMNTLVRDLIRRKHTAIAQDTTRHMQLDIIAQVMLLE